MELNTVVVATDFSEASRAAIETAFNLGLPQGALLYLVHVMETPVPIGPVAGPVLPPPGSGDRDVYALTERLKRLIPEGSKDGVEVRAQLLMGPPAESIADFALEKGADLILVGTHGRKGLARILMGSTAETLLRRAPCQVLVVKQKTPSPPAEPQG